MNDCEILSIAYFDSPRLKHSPCIVLFTHRFVCLKDTCYALSKNSTNQQLLDIQAYNSANEFLKHGVLTEIHGKTSRSCCFLLFSAKHIKIREKHKSLKIF